MFPDSSSSGTISVLDEHGVVLCEENVSSYINQYFVNIGEKLNKDLNATSSTYNRELGCQGIGFTFSRIQVEELGKEITNIKVFKSAGIDNVASYIMRDTFTILEEQFLYNILNKSIELYKFPDDWKKLQLYLYQKSITRN